MTTCGECGFVYEDLPVGQAGGALLAAASAYRALLTTGDAPALRARPAPGTWSALEYGCHVRDVLLVQRDRILRALVEDGPGFPPMHREERVRLARYAEEAPPLVAEEISIAAGLLARLLDVLDPDQLARRCTYGYPTPTEVDLAWVARHTVHEVEHHLGDARRALAGS